MITEKPIDFEAKAADTLDSLLKLKAALPTSIIKKRTTQRVEIRTRVLLRPGNSSSRSDMKIQGVTGDISQGGCQVVFPRTIAVGDVFWLHFSNDVVENTAVLARCMRCCFMKEDAFETGFRFLEPVKLRPQV